MKRNLKFEDMIWPFRYFNLLANLKFLNKNNLYVYVQRGKVSYCAGLEKILTPPWKADRFQYIFNNLSRCWEARDFFFIYIYIWIWKSYAFDIANVGRYTCSNKTRSPCFQPKDYTKKPCIIGKAFHSNNIRPCEQRQSIKLTQKPRTQLHLPT